MKPFSFTNKFIAIAALVCAASIVSCESDLLGTPPSAVSITLLSEPAVTVDDDSATLLCTTSQNATVAIEYGTASGAYDHASVRTSAEGTNHSVSLTNLTPLTTYYYRVVSWLEGSRSFNSDEYQFQTATNSTVLSIATGPTVTPGLTTLSISFTTSDDCTSVVEYGTVSGTYTAATLQTTTASTSHNASLTGLSSGSTYYYRIKLYWNSGNDLVSSQYSTATTTEPAPTAAQKARGIWIIGGLNGATLNTVVGTLALYDPVTDTWYSSPTSFSTTGYTPVSFAGYAALGGKLYVIGGFDSSGNTLNTVQIYDIANNSWSAGATMPTPRANIYASVLNGKIYTLSGSTDHALDAWAGLAPPVAPAPSGVAYEYTPGGTWTAKTGYTATNNTERFSYAYGSTLYSIGGRSSATAVAAIAHDGYIPSLSNVTGGTELAMSTARTGVTGVVSNSGLYDPALILIGGISVIANTTGGFINFPTSATGTMSNLVQYLVYPFTAPAAWQAASNTFPGSGIAFGTAVITNATGSDRIYYFGGTAALGTGASGSLSVRWINPPQPPAAWANSWSLPLADMSPGRWGHGAVTLNE